MNARRVLTLVVLASLFPGTGAAPLRVRAEPPAQGKPDPQKRIQAKKPYEPQFGQQGKDVVWVPTADTMVEQMLDMAKVGPGDYVIDLGSGDGRMVIAAARRGARAHGVEFNAEMVAIARTNADAAKATDLATFEKGDLFEADISKATVVTMFLMDWINLKLRPSLLRLKPGTRIVSNTFSMADWIPDERVQVANQCVNYCTALLWIVPGNIEGTWQLSPGRLTLTQTFQMVSGTLAAWGTTRPITSGRLRGNQLTFSVGASHYDVRVTANALEGTVTSGGKSQAFRATKVGPGRRSSRISVLLRLSRVVSPDVDSNGLPGTRRVLPWCVAEEPFAEWTKSVGARHLADSLRRGRRHRRQRARPRLRAICAAGPQRARRCAQRYP